MLPLMVRFALVLLAAAALAAPAAAEERRYAVSDFDRVIVEGAYRVHLVAGRPSAARAQGRREALDRLSIDVQGQTLRVRRNRNSWVGQSADAGADAGIVTIELATRSVRSTRLIGPARLDVESGRGLNLELSVEGSGTLRAAGVDADHLSLALLGSGSLTVAGTARALAGNVQGTGEIAATALVARSAVIVSTTSGAVAVTVNGPATITNNGLGPIRILGRPVCTIGGISADQVQCGAR
jgi:Putative auto-transporter adhesin, head GIN domain